MRIGVIGTGGIGAYYGAKLIEGGQEVHLVSTPRHVAAVRADGLQVTTDAGQTVVHPASITTDAREVGPVDVVLVTVKLYQLDDAIRHLDAMVGPSTIVVPLENGVTAPHVLEARVGADHVVPGLAVIVAFLEGAGRVRQIGARTGITVGARTVAAQRDGTPGTDPRVAALVAALDSAGVDATAVDDIDRALWAKFALITTFGGVDVLAHATIGEVRQCPSTRALLGLSLDEVRAVANARGIGLTKEDTDGVLAKLDSLAPDATTSMQRDLQAGHPSELEDLNGAVVRLAGEVGVDVPFHSIATDVMRLHAERGHV